MMMRTFRRWALLALMLVIGAVRPISAMGQMGVMVMGDRVMIGSEYVPRRLDLPTKLIVPAGQTVNLPTSGTYDYIEVAGTLRVSRSTNTTVSFTHLIVLPGGVLDVGRVDDPIPCGVQVLLIVRNVPIDTTKDPYQWGNGLVNFGRQTRVGCAKTAFLETAGDLHTGDTHVTLSSGPSGWAVGDEVLIPDTTAPSVVQTTTQYGPLLVARRETPVFIAAINGANVTLNKGLDFDHLSVVTPNNQIALKPRAANLTRNIVLQSENQAGTRGHSVDVGETATWDVEYNAVLGMGRTLAAPIDNTDLSKTPPHIGTNQIARYATHHHHVDSSPGSQEIGNVVRGNPNTAKWGLSVHVTSDVLVQDSIYLDFPGAGMVTEDGPEVRNVFRHNLVAYSGVGSSRPEDAQTFHADQNLTNNCPGCEGSAFWFHGINNTFDGLEAWDSYRGVMLFNQQQPGFSGGGSQLAQNVESYPSVPGVPPDTPFDNTAQNVLVPVAMTNTVTAANTLVGLETWATSRFADVRLTSVNNGYAGHFGVGSDHNHNWFQNPMIVCPILPNIGSYDTGNAAPTVGTHSDLAYTRSFQLDDGYIGGCAMGVEDGGGGAFTNITGTVLQNVVDMNDTSPTATLLDSVQFLEFPQGNSNHRFLFKRNGLLGYNWQPSQPLPTVGVSEWLPAHGSTILARNWNLTKRDYRFFYMAQLGSQNAWYSAPYPQEFNCPVTGLTMLGCWQQYGLAFGGEALPDAQAVQLDGLVNMVAAVGLAPALGPPKAVVTFPTMRAAAAVGTRYAGMVEIDAAVTGDLTKASPDLWFSVDGDPPSNNTVAPSHLDDRVFYTSHASPGMHTVRVWRTGLDGVTELPGSGFASQYFVASGPALGK
jgi:hypothetical protein